MRTTYNDLAPIVPMLRERGTKTLLHVGCGSAPRSRLPKCFQAPDWREVRLDIDRRVKPDIVATLTDLSVVDADSVHAVWSSHNIEHLEGYEVATALKEFHRVLRPGGFVLITLPDLFQIAQMIVDGKAGQVIYTSPAGPITPLDMLFGHQASIARGEHYMAHRTGFTANRLHQELVNEGFADVRVMRGESYDLWGVAIKQ
ncbi:methyltransferase domain-containing protein [Achromobacter sp. GG226]|uniref:class I SAM-dependent methyltransferase n=1 Tax=Verticiella alkaliphila TaxID=2779529 RepID=UPI001C0C9AB9|nr:methyltransferase domain-containing protein [Verticiella sp. GG226]MBU4609708.1 methyltransferase domain-containing protein [Verticiella sp. GG226]